MKNQKPKMRAVLCCKNIWMLELGENNENNAQKTNMQYNGGGV